MFGYGPCRNRSYTLSFRVLRRLGVTLAGDLPFLGRNANLLPKSRQKACNVRNSTRHLNAVLYVQKRCSPGIFDPRPRLPPKE